jgi:hypothetical protein
MDYILGLVSKYICMCRIQIYPKLCSYLESISQVSVKNMFTSEFKLYLVAEVILNLSSLNGSDNIYYVNLIL